MKMWSTKVCVSLLFCVFISFILCEVENARENGKERKPRLITFNAVDDDIEINLEFSIPFLRIPSRKAFNSAFGSWSEGHGFNFPMVNVNPSTLVVGGAAALGASVLVPLLAKLLALKGHQRYSRLLDHAEFSSGGFLDFASQMLVDQEAVRGCALRFTCWTARRGDNVQEKTWRLIMSNDLLTPFVNSTTLEDAMLSAKNGRECSSYGPCPIQEQHIPSLLNNIAVLTHFMG